MSTANDFWREREGGNLWSRWLSFSCPHILIHVLNILTNILFEFTSLYMFIHVLSILNILFTYDTVTFGFLSGREWPPKKTNLWISSRETNLWISSRDMNFLTVFMTSYHFDAVIMTSYYCDVILTPSLWRHIIVTSFWRRHYDVIFLWRHFDAVIMTSA
jgi:hypothetical protein